MKHIGTSRVLHTIRETKTKQISKMHNILVNAKKKRKIGIADRSKMSEVGV